MENQDKSASAKAVADEVKKNIFVGMEEEVLKFWQENKIFEKSVAKEAPKGEYVFYDGPPFATGTPHYGHLVASLMKDTVPRFWTMNGYEVQRKWGWDCHGLPIENIVEKELGTKSKKEIVENVGVEKFNALCRSKVLSYAEEWKKIVTRLGRWVDMDNPYRTMDVNYMESIWWAFKQLWSNDLVYKDYRSMHICPRCETTLSQSEVAEGYKDVKDLSVTAKFELVDEPGTFVLAWTTTPWTLPGNVALAVKASLDYQKLEFKNDYKILNCKKGDKIIIASDQKIETNIFGSILHKGDVLGEYFVNYSKNNVKEKIEFSSREIALKLIGKKYKPLFSVYSDEDFLASNSLIINSENGENVGDGYLHNIKDDGTYEVSSKKDFIDSEERKKIKEKGYRIYAADFVDTETGTGIVHIAPAFGEDDMNLGRQYNLPFIQHVAMDGTFNKEMGERFAGLHVKPKDNVLATDLEILKYLQENNLYFSKAPYTHSYPHCWRCDTPLINYATSSWFVKITEMKPRMLELAEGINWSPEHIKAGRFGQWLSGARDWSISRQRFWASVLPIWECSCGAKKVMGSLEEFYQASNGAITKLILVRHGEAENNVKNIICGSHIKYSLTEKGRGQVEEAAGKIKIAIAGSEDKTVIFSSPVLRAKESARIIAEKLSLEFITDEGIREIGFGSWDDQNEDWLSANNELRQQYDKLSFEGKCGFKRGGDGENCFDVGKRMYGWLVKILQENKGKTIVIVTHGDPVIDLINELKSRNEKESAIALNGSEYPEKASVRIMYVNNSTGKEIDLHKDSVDKINLKCDVCGGEMKRVPDVLDTWFDSGSMPYAQMHYPFENKERFEHNFPAEFIAEGVDQSRCWFYYLHVIAAGIRNNFAYKNVIVNGIVLAEDGKKMSKRLKNYPDPADLFTKYGADALRYYLLSSPVMTAENLNFSEKGVADCLRKVNMILWNVYKFYEMYAGENSPLERGGASAPGCVKGGEDFEPKNILDKWIIARLNQLISEVTDGMKNYDLPRATRPIVLFIDDLSTWYLRRSRDRFKDDNNSPLERGGAERRGVLMPAESDKAAALATTKFVLENLAKVMAPFTPFIAEQLWQKVTAYNFSDPEMSVHLMSFPRRRESSLDTAEVDILEKMGLVRRIVEFGLAKRDEAGIKVRQPLAQLKIKNSELRIEYFDLIKDELNVKEVVCEKGEGDLSVELDLTMTPELIAEGLKRELVRFVNAERKNANLTIGDRITLQISTESEAVKNAVKLFEADLKKDVLAEEIIIGAFEDGKEVDVNGEKAVLKVIKK